MTWQVPHGAVGQLGYECVQPHILYCPLLQLVVRCSSLRRNRLAMLMYELQDD
jgi:hypothetical protein